MVRSDNILSLGVIGIYTFMETPLLRIQRAAFYSMIGYGTNNDKNILWSGVGVKPEQINKYDKTFYKRVV
jgi:hypothetical protein